MIPISLPRANARLAFADERVVNPGHHGVFRASDAYFLVPDVPRPGNAAFTELANRKALACSAVPDELMLRRLPAWGRHHRGHRSVQNDQLPSEEAHPFFIFSWCQQEEDLNSTIGMDATMRRYVARISYDTKIFVLVPSKGHRCPVSLPIITR